MTDARAGEPPAPQQEELVKMCIEGDKVRCRVSTTCTCVGGGGGSVACPVEHAVRAGSCWRMGWIDIEPTAVAVDTLLAVRCGYIIEDKSIPVLEVEYRNVIGCLLYTHVSCV